MEVANLRGRKNDLDFQLVFRLETLKYLLGKECVYFISGSNPKK